MSEVFSLSGNESIFLRKNHILVTCDFCGTQFGKEKKRITQNLKSNHKTYCSKDCKNKAQENNCPQKLKTFHRKYSIKKQLRKNAKIVLNKIKRTYKCINCGYDKHLEVCHIKSVSSYIKENILDSNIINHTDNLIYLCRNCHWEFDNNYIFLVDGKIIPLEKYKVINNYDKKGNYLMDFMLE